MKLKVIRTVCPTLCNPVDCSPPGSPVHGILQARVLEWVAISFSRGSSRSRDRTWVSCIEGRFFTNWATREAPDKEHLITSWLQTPLSHPWFFWVVIWKGLSWVLWLVVFCVVAKGWWLEQEQWEADWVLLLSGSPRNSLYDVSLASCVGFFTA